ALRAAGTARMIHGHTHRPAHHVFEVDGAPAQRWVLTDWDLDGDAPRGGGLRLEGGSLEVFAV
ncbi:MAG TPA: UDP-2,3-diacylglucosamine diphosphatase, partial [Burkholderiaceae bacterium]